MRRQRLSIILGCLCLCLTVAFAHADAEREAQLEREIDDIRDRITDIRRDIDDIRDDIDEIEDDVDDLEDDLRELQPEVAEAEAEFIQAKGQAAALEKEVAQAETALAKTKQARTRTEREMTKKLQRSDEIIEASDELQSADRFYLAAREAVLANLFDDPAYRDLIKKTEAKRVELEEHREQKDAERVITLKLAQELMNLQQAVSELESQTLNASETFVEARDSREHWRVTLRERQKAVPEKVAASPEMVEAETKVEQATTGLEAIMTEARPVFAKRDAAKNAYEAVAGRFAELRNLLAVRQTELADARALLDYKRDQQYLLERLRDHKRRQLSAERRSDD